MKADFVKSFIDYLGFKDECERLAVVLLKSQEDCEYFYVHYYQKSCALLIDLMNFRDYKLSKSDVNLERFIALCNKQVNREAFELTFLQAFSNTELELIGRAVDHEKTSLSDIFRSFSENPRVNILKYVL